MTGQMSREDSIRFRLCRARARLLRPRSRARYRKRLPLLLARGRTRWYCRPRLAHEAEGGTLRDVTTRCAGRHVLIQAVGDRALLTVLGDEGLDLALLHLHMPATVDQLVRILDHDTPSQAS